MNARTARTLQPVVLIAATLAATALLTAPRGEAQCTTTQSAQTIVVEKQVTTRADIVAPSIGMDNCGRFAIAFQERASTLGVEHDVYFLRYDVNTTTMPYTGGDNGTVLSTQSSECTDNTETTKNRIISIAIGPATQPSSSPPMYATWHGELNPVFGTPGGHGFRLRHPTPTGAQTVWTFDQSSKPTPIQTSLCAVNGVQPYNSASVSGADTLIRTSAWTAIAKIGGSPFGLLAETPTADDIRSDDTFADKYAPCIATNERGDSVLVWAEPERPEDGSTSPMDIFIAQFDSTGAVVPSGSPVGIKVNGPDLIVDASQESPAVSFVGNSIVVVFEGPERECAARRRIFARRFQWGGDESPTTQPISLDSIEFAVDNDQFADILHSAVANRPTVALTTSTQPADAGKFFVAWNSRPSVTASVVEVRGRYFTADGTPDGGEFRVNQTTQPTEPGGTNVRRYLSQSGQHAAVYGPDKQVIVTWTAGVDQAGGVFLTYLPPTFASTVPEACLPGDVNGDGFVNGSDIQPFVTYSFDGVPTGVSVAEQARIACAMDCDRSATIDDCDFAPFVWILLGYPTSGDYAGDCDHNCRPDYADIAGLMFPMTNCNPSPLECPCSDPPTDDRCCFCSLIPTPPSPVIVIPDCNENEIDDATDIAEETSVDCNSDGVPDECQLAFYDCNTNGVLDQCDVDPEDPDGDEVVYDDCNSNGLPDECDMAAVYFPSYDCNTNGIPDECDIAEEFSVDCNTNGIPDECDIEAETSEDADTNGIPDECEEESMMMGGGGGEGDGPPSSPYDNPAWETFWQWQSDNAATLAAMSPWDRYKATIDKLVELGLPAAIPWAKVTESSP